MQKIKKLQGMILALVFVFVASLVALPGNTTYAAKKAVPKIKVTGLSKTYTLDQQPGILKATCTGTTKYVQYKVLLTETKTKKVTILTKGYTSKISPAKAYSFKLPTLKAGQYQVRVYARTYGSKASYESFYSTYVLMYNNINLTKNGQVYGGKTAKTMLTNDNVYVKADNITLNNLKVNGTLYLDPGKDGSANLNNVQATNIKVLSGGVNSIHLNDVLAKFLQVLGKENVRVEIKGSTEIATTAVDSSAILQVVAGSFGSVAVNDNAVKGNTTLELRGAFDKPVTALAPVTFKTDATAVVPSVIVAPKDSTAKVVFDGNFKAVEVAKAAQVELTDNAKIAESLKVLASAEIKKAINAEIAKVDLSPVDLNVKISLDGTFKTVEVNKPSLVEVVSGTVNSIITNVKVEIVVAKDATVTNVTSNGNKVDVSGDGSSNTKVDGQPVNTTPSNGGGTVVTSAEKQKLDNWIQNNIALVTSYQLISNNPKFTISSNGNITINSSGLTTTVEDVANSLINTIKDRPFDSKFAALANFTFNKINVGNETLSLYIGEKLKGKAHCIEATNFFYAMDAYGQAVKQYNDPQNLNQQSSYNYLKTSYENLQAKLKQANSDEYTELVAVIKGSIITADQKINVPQLSIEGFNLQNVVVQKGTASKVITPGTGVSINDLKAVLVGSTATSVGSLKASDFKGASITVTLKNSTTNETVVYTYSIN